MPIYRFVKKEASSRDVWKLIIFEGLLTVTSSRGRPGESSGLSGMAQTVRLSAIWLIGITATISTVQHEEAGVELRIGPLATYMSLETYRQWIVR